jgi:hypothetical protein
LLTSFQSRDDASQNRLVLGRFARGRYSCPLRSAEPLLSARAAATRLRPSSRRFSSVSSFHRSADRLPTQRRTP